MENTQSYNANQKLAEIDFYSMFAYVDDVQSFKSLNPTIELCIIQTKFSTKEILGIEMLKSKYKNVEFWLCSENLSKKNISIANVLGIKTVVPSPVKPETIKEYFIKKYGIKVANKNLEEWDFSEIAGLKVMIVDDNKTNIELLEETLSKLNLSIDSYSNPQNALKMLGKEKYDLFLLDIMMPELSGFDFAEKIKENPEYKNTPIMFISALSDSQNKIKSYKLGSYAYVEKPFDVNVLRTQIFNLLKHTKAQEIVTSDKENFLATIVHDLKTPIRAGINALNLLLDENLGKLEDGQCEIVEDLLDSTKYMQDMVENILCKNRIANNQINITKQVYSVEELIKHCIDLTKYITKQKKQRIKFICKTKKILLPIDYVEMKRVLHNLISNASEYSPINGEIIIELFEKDQKLGISVQDFGQGIESENKNEIFGKYMTLAKKNKKVGTGLGLYITKRIVEAHEGEISIESKIGHGTTITILLPIYEKL